MPVKPLFHSSQVQKFVCTLKNCKGRHGHCQVCGCADIFLEHSCPHHLRVLHMLVKPASAINHQIGIDVIRSAHHRSNSCHTNYSHGLSSDVCMSFCAPGNVLIL